jgi:GH18 family chitinase
MRAATFNEENPTSWPLFTTVEEVRPKFSKGTAIMVAIGGWGDTEAFSIAAANDTTRKLFARNVRNMIKDTGADGKHLNRSLCADRHLSHTRS